MVTWIKPMKKNCSLYQFFMVMDYTAVKFIKKMINIFVTGLEEVVVIEGFQGVSVTDAMLLDIAKSLAIIVDCMMKLKNYEHNF